MTGATACDSGVLVAAVIAWHERHDAAASAVEAALSRKALIIPAPVLVECYAILTGLPAQHRLKHADAFHVLRSSFAQARIAGPRARDAWSLLRLWSVDGLGGEATHDALLIRIAVDAGAKTLLTFRRLELERTAGAQLEVVEPV